jgi:large subunit ribosomal protein L20
MPRTTNAVASRRRRKRRLRMARGFRGARSKLFRQATEAVDRAMRLSTIHRKQKKRDFRGIWIIRISAACRERGMSYNRFTNGLKKANISLNRKMLSEIAIHDPAGFDAIVEQAKTALA